MPAQKRPPFTRTRNSLKAVVAIGTVAAAAALVEVALIPGLIIGAATVVTPGLLSGRARRHRTPPKARADLMRRNSPSGLPVERQVLIGSLARSLRLKEATLKTVSFRVVVTTLDFGFNYVVLGELVTAAGLSTISIVAGPFFYFLHETSWTCIRPLLSAGSSSEAARIEKTNYEFFGRRMSHTLAKTLTYRIFATISEFSTNYVVVRDLQTAAWLSSFGFFIGPFIYFAHERLWETLEAESEGVTSQGRIRTRSTSRLIARPAHELKLI